VAAILDALHPDAKGIISALIVFLAFGAAIFGFVQLPSVIKNLASPSSKEHCWELRDLQSGSWKFNKCTGEAAQLAPPATSSASTAASPVPTAASK
jgi:hypothetical protein